MIEGMHHLVLISSLVSPCNFTTQTMCVSCRSKGRTLLRLNNSSAERWVRSQFPLHPSAEIRGQGAHNRVAEHSQPMICQSAPVWMLFWARKDSSMRFSFAFVCNHQLNKISASDPPRTSSDSVSIFVHDYRNPALLDPQNNFKLMVLKRGTVIRPELINMTGLKYSLVSVHRRGVIRQP